MKVAFVSSTFPPYEAGIGNACFQTAKKIQELGHQVTVFVPRQAAGPARPVFPFPVEYLRPLFKVGNASFVQSLTTKLASFDVVHLYYPFFGGDVFVWLASKLFKVPYVISYQQDIYGNTWIRKFIFRFYNALFQPAIMRGAFRVLPLSSDHFDHSQIAKLFPDRTRIAVIPNGVDLDDFSAARRRSNLRGELGIPDDAGVIIFNGALDQAHYFKRLDLLLQALRQLPDSTRLVVVGDGDLRPGLEQLAGQLGLSQRVKFLGRVPNNTVAQYLLASDVLVLPSTDTESFGIVLVEAMACGKPVIATDLHGVRATVHDGLNGFIVRRGSVDDLVKKIKLVLSDKQLARRLGEQGLATVKAEYTWTSIAKRVEILYTQASWT